MKLYAIRYNVKIDSPPLNVKYRVTMDMTGTNILLSLRSCSSDVFGFHTLYTFLESIVAVAVNTSEFGIRAAIAPDAPITPTNQGSNDIFAILNKAKSASALKTLM